MLDSGGKKRSSGFCKGNVSRVKQVLEGKGFLKEKASEGSIFYSIAAELMMIKQDSQRPTPHNLKTQKDFNPRMCCEMNEIHHFYHSIR